jgi:hypothetical protein
MCGAISTARYHAVEQLPYSGVVKHVLWALAVLTLAAAQPSVAGSQSQRGLTVTDRQPVTVKGLGFRPGERVTVVLFLSGRHARTVRVARRGSFVARFAEYADLCTAFTVRALSGSGTSVAIRQRPARSCAALDPVG